MQLAETGAESDGLFSILRGPLTCAIFGNIISLMVSRSHIARQLLHHEHADTDIGTRAGPIAHPKS